MISFVLNGKIVLSDLSIHLKSYSITEASLNSQRYKQNFRNNRKPKIIIMSIKILFDPIGFVADCLSIANAFGLTTKAQKEPLEALKKKVEEICDSMQMLRYQITQESNRIKNMVDINTIAVLRQNMKIIAGKIDDQKIDLLIGLLLRMKQIPADITFAIIVRYKVDDQKLTFGFGGETVEEVESIIEKIISFNFGLSHIEEEKTCYVTLRIRGKYESSQETLAASLLTCIAIYVCDLPKTILLDSSETCEFEPTGNKTIVLLTPSKRKSMEFPVHDEKHILFLIGDTGTGKSSLGNSLLNKNAFNTSKGIVGTVRPTNEMREDLKDGKIVITEIFDTPGLNDTNGLDKINQRTIIDMISIIHVATAVLLTINVDSRITETMLQARNIYREIFGDSIDSMLIIVLTTNSTASEAHLNSILRMHRITLFKIQHNLQEKNIFAISLHDLRTKSQSPSHEIVEKILQHCHGMPHKFISSLNKRYSEIRDALLKKKADVTSELNHFRQDGWNNFEELTRVYENASSVTMRYMPGKTAIGDKRLKFLIRTGNISEKFKEIVSHSSRNLYTVIRVNVYWGYHRESNLCEEFYEKYKYQSNRSDLMQLFADEVHDKWLCLGMKDSGEQANSLYQRKYYNFLVFDPTASAQERLITFLNVKLENNNEDLDQGAIDDIISTSNILKIIRRPRRRNVHTS